MEITNTFTSKGNPITIVGDMDDNTMEQATNCLSVEEGAWGVASADNHFAYSQPVGLTAFYRDLISVSGVGYDIGCGNKAVRTDMLASDLDIHDLRGVVDDIERRISFGVGQPAEELTDHEVLDAIEDADFEPQRKLAATARKQLGTVGGGNHYVDLFESVEDGQLWVGVHFGSRGFGHKTATGFLHLGRDGEFITDKDFNEDSLALPVTFPIGSWEGEAYLSAMTLAGEYAYAGRDIVVDKVLDILGTGINYEVHNHHNYAWQEFHNGEQWWAVRKGCTPAWNDQAGFVGATMAENSVILKGTPETERLVGASTVHGAGRAMSRTRAAGKVRKRWTCTNRECDWFQPPHTHKPADGNCPECGHNKIAKRFVQMGTAEVSWTDALDDLAHKGIELRGGAADEAPLAYKRLDEVLAAHGDTVAIVQELRPIAVLMAGAGVPADD